jgi:hypothetical protein
MKCFLVSLAVMAPCAIATSQVIVMPPIVVSGGGACGASCGGGTGGGGGGGLGQDDSNFAGEVHENSEDELGWKLIVRATLATWQPPCVKPGQEYKQNYDDAMKSCSDTVDSSVPLWIQLLNLTANTSAKVVGCNARSAAIQAQYSSVTNFPNSGAMCQ